MRLLLRILLSLASLVLVAVLTVLLIAPQSAIPVLEALAEVSLVLRVAIVVVFYAVMLGILYLRLRFRPRGHGADMLTVNSGGAVTAITVESVRERVLKAVRDIADVGNVVATLKSIRGRADIELDVTMKSDEVNIPAKQREISRAIEQVIKKQLGLRMAGPARISIRLSEPKGTSGVVSSPNAPISPPVVSSPPPASPLVSPPLSPPPSTASQAPVVMPPVVAPVVAPPPTPTPAPASPPASPSTQPNMATITGADEVKPERNFETTENLPIPAYVKDRETAPTSLSSPVKSSTPEESIPMPDFDLFGDKGDGDVDDDDGADIGAADIGDDAGDTLADEPGDDLPDEFDALLNEGDVSDTDSDEDSKDKISPDF